MTAQENHAKIVEILLDKKLHKLQVSKQTGICRQKIYNVIQGRGYFSPKQIDLLNLNLGIKNE
jgi:predicted transcriptional regulator